MFEKYFKGHVDIDEVCEAISDFNELSIVDHELLVPSGEDEAVEAASELFLILSNAELISDDDLDTMPPIVIDLFIKLQKLIPVEEGEEDTEDEEFTVETVEAEVVEDEIIDEDEEEGVEDDVDEPEDEEIIEEEFEDEPEDEAVEEDEDEEIIDEDEVVEEVEEEEGTDDEDEDEVDELAEEPVELAEEEPQPKKKKGGRPKSEKAEEKPEKKKKSSRAGKKLTDEEMKKNPKFFIIPEERDDFGYGVATSAATINRILVQGYKSVNEIAKQAGCKVTRVSPHFSGLVRRGYKVMKTYRDDDGKQTPVYKLLPAKKIEADKQQVEEKPKGKKIK